MTLDERVTYLAPHPATPRSHASRWPMEAA